MSIPCGDIGGLPVGMMITGKWWDEPAVYKAAYAYEQAYRWTPTSEPA